MCLYCIKYKNINNLCYNINEMGGLLWQNGLKNYLNQTKNKKK